MRVGSVRRAERYIGLAVLAGVSSAAGAQQTQTGLIVSAGGSAESNPYNDANTSGLQIAATAELRPWAQIRDERSTIDIGGQAQFRQFFGRYGLEDNYGLSAGATARVSEQVTLHSTAGFSYNAGGFSAFGRPSLLVADPNAPLPVDQPIDPALTDAFALGRRTRTTGLSGGVGADVKLNAYSNVSVSLDGRTNRYKALGLSDYDNVTGQLSYSHQLSEFTSIGAIATVSQADYGKTNVGDARTISMLGSVDRRLNANWSLSGSVGAAFTKINQLPGQPDVKFSSLTARVGFCRQAEFSRFCINGNRSPEPSADGSVRVSNAITADYSLRTSERGTLSLSGAYSRTGRSRGTLFTLPPTEFLNGSARYDTQLTERLTAYVGGTFSKIYSTFSQRRANFGINAGIQFRFGALK